MYSMSRKTSMGMGRIFFTESMGEGNFGLNTREKKTWLQSQERVLYISKNFSPPIAKNEGNPEKILNQLDLPWDIPKSTYWLDAPNKNSEIGLKINTTKADILGISQKKEWFLRNIANKIFRNAEQKWNITLTDENKVKFLLGLQAAMEVKDISEKQRYTIVWRFAQGFLTQSNNTHIETTEQIHADAASSPMADNNDGKTHSIVAVSTGTTSPASTIVSTNTDPESLGRDLLLGSPGTEISTETTAWSPDTIDITDVAAQVQSYDTQTAYLHTDLNIYRTEEANNIEEQSRNTNRPQHTELSNEEYEMINTKNSNWDPEYIANMSPGSSAQLDWPDDGWVSQVRCTRLSGGDFRLQFPDCEYIVDDDPAHPQIAKKEIKFIQEVAETPLVRRLLNMGTGSFNLFRDRVQAKYDPTGKSKENPEQLIKFMLEAILSVTLGDKDGLGEWTSKIPRGIFASPNIPLDMIQKSMRYASSSQKLMMSYALAEQWVFDIDSRKFDPSIISRI